jgi:hypothetical protein
MTPNEQAIADYFANRTIPSGLGTRESACSIAGINVALTGTLTDKIPDCMSEVIGHWIIVIQDSMLSSIRNSARWKSLLPYAAGTGRNKETERLAIILDWMWTVVLPTLQPIANENGFGSEWEAMLREKTERAALAAWSAADAVREEAESETAEYAAESAADAASWAMRVASAVDAATWVGEGRAAANAADAAADAAANAAAVEVVWKKFDPCGLLKRLIAA